MCRTNILVLGEGPGERGRGEYLRAGVETREGERSGGKEIREIREELLQIFCWKNASQDAAGQPKYERRSEVLVAA